MKYMREGWGCYRDALWGRGGEVCLGSGGEQGLIEKMWKLRFEQWEWGSERTFMGDTRCFLCFLVRPKCLTKGKLTKQILQSLFDLGAWAKIPPSSNTTRSPSVFRIQKTSKVVFYLFGWLMWCLFIYLVFWPCHMACGMIPWPGVKPRPPQWKYPNPNHQGTPQSVISFFLK